MNIALVVIGSIDGYVMVLGIRNAWYSHQRVTLWCNGLHSGFVRGGPEFDSHWGRVVTNAFWQPANFLKYFPIR